MTHLASCLTLTGRPCTWCSSSSICRWYPNLHFDIRANLAAKIDLLESCTASVRSWLLHNDGLQLNPTKSELIQFTSGHGCDVSTTHHHMSRHATLSSSFHRQWRASVSSSTANLHSPRHAGFTYVHCDMCAIHYQTMSWKQLPAALSASGLIIATLCLLTCISNFKSLQRVQNTLAWMVLRRGKFEHITPALIDLHCVPK